ncbi:secreted protein containing DUF1552 [Rhodopirellula maiorica SM1]|uniref:Secreted protein containing DUF1552 n=1 Tax=Rhodopirellula maiorica SM1 TaxID=1265738 RepID=M5S2U5_9BACT|nr:DUF1552 domain-containing protein [Rhodopirellula maiorica]EMI21957.1 secreted protein containing DUF1552 [Rhodopirellula maiorica SM1]
MNANRRHVLKGLGGVLSLPLLEASVSNVDAATTTSQTPTRLLVVGNPLGAHPEHFFPTDFGKNFTISPTLKPLEWAKDRMTIVSHTDHGMNNGHGREISFLSGVLPANAAAYPEKNMSVDQVMARHTSGKVRYSSINAALERGIRMNWTANGTELEPFTDPQRLFDHLFLNLSAKEKKVRRELIERNGSILDAVSGQFARLQQRASQSDKQRLEQYANSLRELENSFADRSAWIDRDKPKFDISEHFQQYEVTVENRYNAIFDMIAYAFQTDMTRVATVGFPNELKYTDVEGVTRGYHACTHNGQDEAIISELVAIESFQIAQLSRCMKKLDSIPEPNANGSMLDHTIVLFGSGMGYGGTHSNRNLPIMVAGGGFKHLGHVDARNNAGANMPLCNLYVTLLQRFGIERDKFNTSTGSFDLPFAV